MAYNITILLPLIGKWYKCEMERDRETGEGGDRERKNEKDKNFIKAIKNLKYGGIYTY